MSLDLGLNLLLNLGLSLSIDPCHNDNDAGDERRGIMLLMMTARSTWFLISDSPTGLRPQRYGMASKTGSGIALPAGNSTAWPTGHVLLATYCIAHWQHLTSPTGNALASPTGTSRPHSSASCESSLWWLWWSWWSWFPRARLGLKCLASISWMS